MKTGDKDTSKGTSFWGMFFSVALHLTVLVLVLFWGFSGTSNHNSSSGPIQVSLSGIGPGGGQDSNASSQQNKTPQEPKKAEPPKVEKKEEVKAAPPEPEKKEPPKEPEKEKVKKEEPEEEPREEKPKEVVKEEPEKKEVIPLETEKKKEVKKEEKKEVAEKPKPTEKPKTEAKKTTASSKKNLESEKNKVLQDIKRKKVLEDLQDGEEGSPEAEEEMGEEQRLAMSDSGEPPGEPGPGDSSEGSENEGSESMEGSGSGSSLNPVLLQLYTDKVHQKISRNWRIPPGVPTDGNMQAMIFFKVDQSGKVFDVRVNESSGNAAFDEYCVSAIYKSAPLPPPPSEFAQEAKTSGVLVPFKNKTY